jgi:TolA-binding protein
MKTLLCTAVVLSLMAATAQAQNASQKPSPPGSTQAEAHARGPAPESDAGELEQLRADLRQLTSLVSQMRTNLAFVQTTQTPLKHQFELEADAWQVVVERMKRRLDSMEEKRPAKPGQ